ncbi:MAG: RdgB/HAM1 family non-canonical purine NTP pyrophosphatase [Chloroflexi bacterium]|nr:RdgB/HAM1 family non-canonical purine NTP pyrophosphatase [Chloroflexota bacterium]
MLDLLLATTNPGKIAEMRSLLAGADFLRLHTPEELGIALDVVEDGADYAENAALKAGAYCAASGFAALADDSGLEVEAINGAPGLFSARYAPQKGADDADRRRFLLKQLNGISGPWRAKFRSTVCVAEPNGGLHFTSGECLGEIAALERGTHGFGYDPVFQVAGINKTMAQLTMGEKNKLSHRAKAMAAMLATLESLNPG